MLVFIEGISGAGKSTMVKMLTSELIANGYKTESFVEFDYRNPIDFYCTAYFKYEDYQLLCAEYSEFAGIIHKNTVLADDVRLVRYYNEDTPLFDGELLSEMKCREFCYHPKNLVPVEEYTRTYAAVWRNYVKQLDHTYDFVIFDGSLLHHPLNDMMRNYNADNRQLLQHVDILLASLAEVPFGIFYIDVENIKQQLTRARIDRKEPLPTQEDIGFWTERQNNDRYVLKNIKCNSSSYKLLHNDRNFIRAEIYKNITGVSRNG